MHLTLKRIKRLLMLLTLLLTLSGCSSVLQLGAADDISQSPTETTSAEPVELVEPAAQVEATETSEEVASEETKSSDITQTNTAEAEVASVNSTSAPSSVAEVATVEPDAANPPLGFISEDFTLVRNTGRPQFVYTFADW